MAWKKRINEVKSSLVRRREPEKATVDWNRHASAVLQRSKTRWLCCLLPHNSFHHVICHALMLPFHRILTTSSTASSLFASSHSRIYIRLAHNSGKPSALRHRDWGVVGRLSRPPALSEEEPNEEEEEGRKTAVRYQTDNYTPVSNPTPSRWSQHRASLKTKFPKGWAPPHKLSRAAMDGLRALHAHEPDTFTTPVLADKFRISPEAVRRILRGKWQPTQEQRARLLDREKRYRQDRIRSKRAMERMGKAENKWRKTGHQT